MGVFGLAALIGLFVFATYKGGDATDAVGPVTIWGTLPKAPVEAALSALTPNDPLLKDVTYVAKDEDTLSGDLATAIATGKSPDLIIASQEDLKALAKFISPIPESTLSAATIDKTFVKESRLFSAFGGGYYGIPLLVDLMVFFANCSIFFSRGVVKLLVIWELLIGFVFMVVTFSPSKQVTRALIGLGTYDNIDQARGILSTLFLQAGVPISGVTQGGGVVGALGVKADGGVPPGRSVVTFYTQFADPSKVSYTWNVSLDSSSRLFLAGDAALYLGYASHARFLREANPNLDIVVSEVPQPATANIKSTYGLLYASMIPTGAKNPNGAFQVAAVLTHAGEQAALASATGLAPATLSVLADSPSDPALAVAYQEALYADGWLSPSPKTTDTIFSSMINNVITGRFTVESALGYAEQALSVALQQP
jgi:ABC-type glycerol-3-phosphate transport system substrate-binding protein